MARRARRAPAESKVDLTPMIDVVFQLIIFFVVTVNLEQESILKEIKLPIARYSRDQRKHPGQITIQVSSKGYFYIGAGSKYTKNQLRKVMRNAVRRSSAEIPVLIRGDARASHKAIRTAMDACAAEGLYRIRFATTKKQGG